MSNKPQKQTEAEFLASIEGLDETAKQTVIKAREQFNTAMEEMKADMISKEDVETILTETLKTATAESKEMIEKLHAAAIKQGQEIANLKNRRESGVQAKSFAEQIKEQIEANKDAFESYKSNALQSFKLTLDVAQAQKASANMTTSNINSTPNVVSTSVVPGLIGPMDIEPMVINFCDVARTNSAIIHYVEKKNRDGSTIFISEAAAKNKIDFDIVKNTSNARKVADYIKVSDEMLDDVDFMAAEIESELMYQIRKAAGSGVLSGDGNAPNLKGITQYAAAYSLTTVLTETPNNYDALIAAATQIKINGGIPTHAFLSPVDVANMKINKGTTGHYVIVNGEMTLLPFQVVEVADFTVGKLLMGDMRKSKVRVLQDVTVEYGYDSDDFTKNMKTVRAETRLHHYIADNHAAAFVYDDISDIITAITAA